MKHLYHNDETLVSNNSNYSIQLFLDEEKWVTDNFIYHPYITYIYACILIYYNPMVTDDR